MSCPRRIRKLPINGAALLAVAIMLAMETWQISTAATADGILTGPRIHCDQEFFDFGYVPQDVYVSHTYWLKNPGSETATIHQLRPNCGCTQAPLTDSVIKVGDSVPVEIIFGTHRMLGKAEKYTRIISNAAGRVPVLTIRAHAIADTAKILPLEYSLGPATTDRWGEGERRVDLVVPVTIKNISPNPLQLGADEPIDPGIRLSEKEFALGAGESRTIEARVRSYRTVKFNKSVTFETAGTPGIRFTLPLDSLKQ